jgi:predicted nucleic acid-binding protein
VLSWAHEHGDFEAILDDRAARKCAVIERIPVRGTLGVILAAKVRGFPRAKPVCDDIVRAGLRIHPTVLRDALKLVGE